jgi:transcriptional activator of cad operon
VASVDAGPGPVPDPASPPAGPSSAVGAPAPAIGPAASVADSHIQASAAPALSVADASTREQIAIRRRTVASVAAVGVALCLALLAGVFVHGKRLSSARATVPPQRSVAVLPFLDLTTQAMNEEYFADGMTEELIDKLSKMPGLRVPSPTSSFYFKGNSTKVAQIARSLGVAYVLDGSIRKSADTLRVAARLVRADDGYVVWSETYDRPVGNQLRVQDDIASEVSKAVSASLH